MILAAGEGTRLKPLTNRIPKALVEVGGRPLLARVVDRLIQIGVTRIILNTHHHGEQIEGWVRRYLDETPRGVSIVLSPEPGGPFDTGGGLFHAASLFRGEAPFFLHNVDVLSRIPLHSLMHRHLEARGAGVSGSGLGGARSSKSARAAGPPGRTPAEDGARKAIGQDAAAASDTDPEDRLIASLAVQDRDAHRTLLFDDVGLLGWENRGSDRAPEGSFRARDAVGDVRRRAFTGIHVVEPRIFAVGTRTSTYLEASTAGESRPGTAPETPAGRPSPISAAVFSIITLYLELAADGWVIHPLDVTGHDWLDVGTPQRLDEARHRFSR